MEVRMRIMRFVPITIAAALLLCAPAPQFAQWLNYPTAGVPRLPNGKPNLTARAPRTACLPPLASDGAASLALHGAP